MISDKSIFRFMHFYLHCIFILLLYSIICHFVNEYLVYFKKSCIDGEFAAMFKEDAWGLNFVISVVISNRDNFRTSFLKPKWGLEKQHIPWAQFFNMRKLVARSLRWFHIRNPYATIFLKLF